MIKKITLITTIALGVASCEQEGNLKLQESTTARESIESSNLLASTSPAISPMATFTNNSSSGSGGAILNPEHGQPGHRCDIPVGSPLPGTALTKSNESTNNNLNVSPVKLNPEHGQPGHRCDIPVGAPLDSPPTTTNEPEAEPQNIQINPMQQAPSNSSDENLELNPEHGQPGHRCDIPVGAPLSTPIQENNESPVEITPIEVE